MTLSLLNLFIGLLLLILCIAILAVLYKNKLLKIKLEQTEQLLIRSHKSERRSKEKFADVIHDELQGDLIATKNFIFIHGQLKDEKDKNEILSNIQSTLEASILTAKRLSHELKPPFLDSGVFIKAVQYYFDSLNKSGDKHFFVVSNVSDFTMPEEKTYTLFKIVELFCDYMISEETVQQFSLNIRSNNEIEFIDNGKQLLLNFNDNPAYENLFLNLPSYLKLINGELRRLDAQKGNHFVIKINN